MPVADLTGSIMPSRPGNLLKDVVVDALGTMYVGCCSSPPSASRHCHGAMMTPVQEASPTSIPRAVARRGSRSGRMGGAVHNAGAW